MNVPREKMSFDLRQRYRLAAQLIETVRKKKPLRILDAGGREGYLHNFLPEDEITNLDLEFFPGDSFVVGDLLLLPFTAGTFDLVVSLDVLEHIEPGRRGGVLDEIDRVSRDYFIVGAPFRDRKVVEAEKLANEFHLRATGRENEFLAEHLRLGLPELEEVTSWIEDRGYQSVILPNNYLPFWLVMMGLSAYFTSLPRPGDLMAAVTELYEINFSRYDAQSPAYRKILLIAKSGPLDQEAIRKRFAPAPFSEDSGKRAWNFADRVLSELVTDRERKLLELQEEINRLQAELARRDEDCRRARAELEGIKGTPAYRFYKNTWGRIRGS